jgi:hypothetical protein
MLATPPRWRRRWPVDACNAAPGGGVEPCRAACFRWYYVAHRGEGWRLYKDHKHHVTSVMCTAPPASNRRIFLDGVYAYTLHFICVITGTTHAPSVLMRWLPVLNVFTRLVLLCAGIALFATRPHHCVDGLGITPYQSSEWDPLTVRDWHAGTLPGMQVFAAPGNFIVISLWFCTVTSFFLFEVFRCALVFTGRWRASENVMDMVWSSISCFSIPLLFVLVAIQLGTRDLVVLLLILVIATTSGVCGVVAEHVRTLVNPYVIDGIADTVLFMLRVMQEVTILIVSQVTTLPVVINCIQPGQTVSNTQVVISVLFSVLMYAITVTCYRHHRLCSIFEQTWPSQVSMKAWCDPEPAPCKLDSVDAVDLGSASAVDKWQRLRGRQPSCLSALRKSSVKDVDGQVVALADIQDPLDLQSSEEMFSALYGCHLYRDDPSADVVHIVDHNHQVVTVKLTEDFNMYNHFHSKSAVTRDGVFSRGVHIAHLGAGPQLFHTSIDTNGANTRNMIGTLVEWRRYYIINILIDALLLVILLDMTDLTGTC